MEESAQGPAEFDEVEDLSESVAELNMSATAYTLNLMVIWTDAYECHLSFKTSSCEMTTATRAKVILRIGKYTNFLNVVLKNSNIDATARRVYTKRLNFEESGLTNDMNKMNRCEIPNFCEIRGEKLAHLAVAFTANGGNAGQARKGPDARWRSATIGKAGTRETFVHEIGHIFGNRENRNDEPGDNCIGSKTYFGYRSPDFKYRDIMSWQCIVGTYDCGVKVTKDCERIPHFGDPAIKYEGYKTGSATECSACQMRKALPTIIGVMPR